MTAGFPLRAALRCLLRSERHMRQRAAADNAAAPAAIRILLTDGIPCYIRAVRNSS